MAAAEIILLTVTCSCSLMSSSRRSAYKLPPSTSPLVSVQQSQAARREKALEDQKRKRALKFDLSRFAELKLDDDEEEDEEGDGDEEIDQDGFKVVHSGMSSFTSAMKEPLSETSTLLTTTTMDTSIQKLKPKYSKPKPKKKKGRKRATSNAQWADKIMYAELLEMSDSDVAASAMNLDNNDFDGLPPDLHTSWVALSPVPVGKRCLAITRDGPGRNPIPRSKNARNSRGYESNTSLRSRLHGKHISLFPGMSSSVSTDPSSEKSEKLDSWFFPSPLPPSTILDCILDENWTQNGVLHVLDVLRWKGQEVGECEAGMRFWWRDTRLNELSALPLPPQPSFQTNTPALRSTSLPPPSSSSPANSLSTYTYPYPTMLLPVPYHPAPLSLSILLDVVVPAARSIRNVNVNLPIPSSSLSGDTGGGDMDVDFFGSAGASSHPIPPTKEHQISSDGLLLYLAEATYESGSSPLSNWVPLKPLSSTSTLDIESTGDEDGNTRTTAITNSTNINGPLHTFEK
ncbi:hypothetical protein J3R30DRAFT_3406590 [Lentinula aciculospora]|uniref:Snurportin-1 n=1 Tax=Lentinula aciculospora TaxID=153920 RepID=A0A9W9A402_9AGAR|nr:hypothetical protein J3R30DRAFT_3406590 [Lentinula aciculospora]